MPKFSTQEILSNDESSFGENGTSPASNTWSERLPVKNVSADLKQGKIDDTAIQVYQNERRPGYNGPREGTLELTMPWYGHNTAATGAITETILYTLLKKGLGNGVTVAGDVVGAVPTTTDIQTTSTAHYIVLVGTKGDGGGDGQPYVYSDTGGTGKVALPAAPTAGHVVYGSQMVYPSETLSTTKRFLVAHTMSGEQYHCMGCQLAGLKFSLPLGGEPEVTLVYNVANWDRASETTPSGVSLPASNWAIVAAGSMNIQTVSTTTRNVVSPSSVELSIDLGLSANRSINVVGLYQTVSSWERTMSKAALTISLPKDTTYETLWDTDGSSATAKHILFSSSPRAGRAVGFYLPNCFIAGERPRATNVDDLIYQNVTFLAREGQTTTNELTRAPFILFMA